MYIYRLIGRPFFIHFCYPTWRGHDNTRCHQTPLIHNCDDYSFSESSVVVLEGKLKSHSWKLYIWLWLNLFVYWYYKLKTLLKWKTPLWAPKQLSNHPFKVLYIWYYVITGTLIVYNNGSATTKGICDVLTTVPHSRTTRFSLSFFRPSWPEFFCFLYFFFLQRNAFQGNKRQGNFFSCFKKIFLPFFFYEKRLFISRIINKSWSKLLDVDRWSYATRFSHFQSQYLYYNWLCVRWNNWIKHVASKWPKTVQWVFCLVVFGWFCYLGIQERHLLSIFVIRIIG